MVHKRPFSLVIDTQLTHDVAATLPVSAQLVTRDVTFWQRCGNVVPWSAMELD